MRHGLCALVLGFSALAAPGPSAGSWIERLVGPYAGSVAAVRRTDGKREIVLVGPSGKETRLARLQEGEEPVGWNGPRSLEIVRRRAVGGKGRGGGWPDARVEHGTRYLLLGSTIHCWRGPGYSKVETRRMQQYGFSKDGASLYVVLRGESYGDLPELWGYDLRAGSEPAWKVRLRLPPDLVLSSLHKDLADAGRSVLVFCHRVGADPSVPPRTARPVVVSLDKRTGALRELAKGLEPDGDMVFERFRLVPFPGSPRIAMLLGGKVVVANTEG